MNGRDSVAVKLAFKLMAIKSAKWSVHPGIKTILSWIWYQWPANRVLYHCFYQTQAVTQKVQKDSCRRKRIFAIICEKYFSFAKLIDSFMLQMRKNVWIGRWILFRDEVVRVYITSGMTDFFVWSQIAEILQLAHTCYRVKFFGKPVFSPLKYSLNFFATRARATDAICSTIKLGLIWRAVLTEMQCKSIWSATIFDKNFICVA